MKIVGELSLLSSEFRRLWGRNEVRDSVHGSKTIRHPRVGEIDVEWDAYPLHGVPGPMLVVFVPQSGHEDRLSLLSTAVGRPGREAGRSPSESPSA